MFSTWSNGSILIVTISTKFKFPALVIKRIVNSLVDIIVIRAIQHKWFILAYKLILPLYLQLFVCIYYIFNYNHIINFSFWWIYVTFKPYIVA